MSRVSINCPHCGKTTRVDFSVNLSTQKCDRCGIRFSSVNTGLAGSREVQLTEPPDWRRAHTGDWDETADSSPTAHATAPGTPSRAAWMAVGAAFLVIAATVATIARRSPSATPAVPPMTSPGQPGTTTAGDTGKIIGYEALRDRIQAATAVARQYLSARTVEEMLPLILNREALEQRLRTYYSEGEGRDHLPMPEFTLAPTDRQVYVDLLEAVMISYTTPGQVPRAVALRLDPAGRWLIDWPSAAALNEVPLAQFREKRETTPRLFRLLAVRDDYFNRTFASDREWVCVRLVDPTRNHRFYAYARRDSPLGAAILKAPLTRRDATAPVLLRLRFPPDAPSDDQVEITEFLGMGWILSDATREPGFDASAAPPPAPATASPPAATGR